MPNLVHPVKSCPSCSKKMFEVSTPISHFVIMVYFQVFGAFLVKRKDVGRTIETIVAPFPMLEVSAHLSQQGLSLI